MELRYSNCHPDRKHFANGLCKPCFRGPYLKKWYALNRRGVLGKRATCHPDRPHYAKGCCHLCWQRGYVREQGVQPFRPAQMATCHPDRKVAGHGLCPSCWHNQWYAKNKEGQRQYRRRQLLKKYGYIGDTQRLYAAGCAICGATEKLHIDHDHATMRFRGLLCHFHNTALGSFKDDVSHLRRAARYLESQGLAAALTSEGA